MVHSLIKILCFTLLCFTVSGGGGSLFSSTTSLLDLLSEDKLKVGDIPSDCSLDKKKNNKKSHDPHGSIQTEGSELAFFFNQFQSCQIAREQAKNSTQIDKDEVEAFCKIAREDVFQKLEELRKNYENRSGVGLTCTTENDNSALYYITKSDGDRGTDEGATAKHACYFSYFLPSGGVIRTGLSTDLYTEIVGVSLNGNDKLEQRSMDRVQLEGVYEWWQSEKLKLGAGVYLSQINRGGSSLGSNIQDRWHKMNGLYTYEDVTDEQLAGFPKYGGGGIVTAQYIHVDQAYKHVEFNIESHARVEAGLEAGKFRSFANVGSSVTTRLYPSSKNRGFYTEFKVMSDLESKTFGSDSNLALNVGGGAAVGLDMQGKHGGGFNFEMGATHTQNLLYDGVDILDRGRKTIIEDDGQDRYTTQAKQRFSVYVSAKKTFGNRRNRESRRLYKTTLMDVISDLELAIQKEENGLVRHSLQEELKKRQFELSQIK